MVEGDRQYYMITLFDSNIFIAALHSKDQNNDKAIEFLKNFENGKIKTIYITNLILL